MNKKIVIIIGFVLIVAGLYFYKTQNVPPVLSNVTNQTQPGSTTVETFQQVFAHNLPVLTELGAEWCSPCKQMKPILQQLRGEYNGKLVVDQVNVDMETDKVRSYAKYVQLRVIPVQLLIAADGKLLWKHEGYIDETELRRIISEKTGVS